MSLEDSFRELRCKWFIHHLKSHAHKREWEDAVATETREQYNKQLRKKFDAHTEELILGHKRAIAPICQHDMQ